MVVKVHGVFRSATELRDYAPGEVVFEAGTPGHEMFGVASGVVELRFPDGRVLQVGPDETFGELALIDSSPRAATAVALEATQLAVIDERRFLFLTHETPMFALQVMSSLGERLRSSNGS